MQRWGRHVARARGINSVAVTGNDQRQKYRHRRRDNMHLIHSLPHRHSHTQDDNSGSTSYTDESENIQQNRQDTKTPDAPPSTSRLIFAQLFHGNFQTQKDINAPRAAFSRRKCRFFVPFRSTWGIIAHIPIRSGPPPPFSPAMHATGQSIGDWTSQKQPGYYKAHQCTIVNVSTAAVKSKFSPSHQLLDGSRNSRVSLEMQRVVI